MCASEAYLLESADSSSDSNRSVLSAPGNAVIPACVQWLGERIMEANYSL